jgi:NAD+ diphosphatase
MGFVGNPLDRADRLRHSPEALAAARADPRALVLPFCELRPSLTGSEEAPQLGWVSAASLAPDTDLLLLGLDGAGVPHFAAGVSESPDGARATDARAAAMRLTGVDSGILAQARAMLAWHSRHGACAVCGAPSRIERGGYLRRCTVCAAEHFPRTDPVTIMLIVQPGHCVLGRKKEFPKNTFSALAGFLEPGETIEDAVRREVMEEAGLTVGRVRYVASQPWPFPSTLMIGCFAEAISNDITPDTEELEAVAWFSLEDCRAALAGQGPFIMASPVAIAHHLLKSWVQMHELRA